MKTLLFLCAVSSLAHSQVQFGFHVGAKPKPQPQKGDSSQNTPAPAQDQAATDAWRAAQRQAGDRLVRLWRDSKLTPQPLTSSDQWANEALNDLTQVAQLDALKKGCADGSYRGERDGGDEAHSAKTMCPLIADAATHFKNALRIWANAFAESRLSSLDEHASKVEKDKQVFLQDAYKGITAAERREYVSSFVKRYYDALGEPVPDALLGKVDEKVAHMHKVIDAVAQEGKLEKPAARDAGAERAISAYYSDLYKGIQIKKVWMTDSTWKIKQNEIGIITNRYKNGSILIKAKDADYCIIVPAAVGQRYAGAGHYASDYNVDEYVSGIPVKCK